MRDLQSIQAVNDAAVENYHTRKSLEYAATVLEQLAMDQRRHSRAFIKTSPFYRSCESVAVAAELGAAELRKLAEGKE